MGAVVLLFSIYTFLYLIRTTDRNRTMMGDQQVVVRRDTPINIVHAKAAVANQVNKNRMEKLHTLSIGTRT